MNNDDEKMHEELLRAFNEYYKANLIWKLKKTRKGSVQTRKWLSEIRRLCSARRKVIANWQHDDTAEKWSCNNNNPEGYNQHKKRDN